MTIRDDKFIEMIVKYYEDTLGLDKFYDDKNAPYVLADLFEKVSGFVNYFTEDEEYYSLTPYGEKIARELRAEKINRYNELYQLYKNMNLSIGEYQEMMDLKNEIDRWN